METAWKELWFHIQCGSVGLEHDEVFLHQAQSAWLGDWTVGWGSGHDTPRHNILEFPSLLLFLPILGCVIVS